MNIYVCVYFCIDGALLVKEEVFPYNLVKVCAQMQAAVGNSFSVVSKVKNQKADFKIPNIL